MHASALHAHMPVMKHCNQLLQYILGLQDIQAIPKAGMADGSAMLTVRMQMHLFIAHKIDQSMKNYEQYIY